MKLIDKIRRIFRLRPAPLTPRKRKETPKGYWKTKEGEILKISDMEITHIQNCIRMIERKAERMLGKCELNFLVYDDEHDPFFDEYEWDATVIDYCKKYREYRDLWEELNKRVKRRKK